MTSRDERRSDDERWREWQEQQAARNVAVLTAQQREAERAHLAELWSIRLAVAEEVGAVGDAEDDERQAEKARRQRLMALKGRWLETVSELRGADYRAGRKGQAADEVMPEALWSVPLLPVHDGLEDLLSGVARQATRRATKRDRQDDGRKATDAEAAKLRATLDAISARQAARRAA